MSEPETLIFWLGFVLGVAAASLFWRAVLGPCEESTKRYTPEHLRKLPRGGSATAPRK